MPSSRATASATGLASPVSIATSMPSSCSRRTASADSGRMASATANAASDALALDADRSRPARWPRPSSANSTQLGRQRRRRAAPSRFGPPTASRRPSTTRLRRRGRGSPRSRSARGIVEPALARARHDGPRDRVLGVLLDRGGEPERVRLGRAAGRAHADDAMLAERERAGLVEDDRGEEARLLEPAPVAHQQPVARAERGRDGDDERHREPERVRAGDDEHRDEPLDGERGLGAGSEPRDEGQRTRRRARRW